MTKYTVNLQIRKERPDRTGRCLIRIRVFYNKKSKYVSTGIKVKPEHWDDCSQKIVHSVPNAREMNFKIHEQLQNYTKELLDVERITGSLDTGKIDKIVKNNDLFDFYAYANNFFNTFKEQFKEETLLTYARDLEKLKEFAPQLLIHDITGEFIAKYHQFLIHVRNNEQNTCNKALKPIKKVLTYARDVDHIISTNPFKVYNIAKAKTTPTYLTMDELKILWNVVIHDKKMAGSLYYTGLYILFSCYTGLRYQDLKQIHGGEVIKGDRIFLTMVKGQEPLNLPLLTQAKTIQALIGNHKILSNQKGNEYLKIIQDIAGLSKNLTWHVGRHTMAMMLADLGFDKEVCAVLLGHKSLKSTAVYHRISSTRGNQEVARVQQKLNELGL